MTFTWEIAYTVWMSDCTYEVQLGRYYQNIGGNNFQGTYVFYLGVENITAYSMFMGGSAIVTEPSIITKPLSIGLLEPKFYLETYVHIKLVVNDDIHGTDTVDERMIPITVIGPVSPPSSSQPPPNNTTTTNTTINLTTISIATSSTSTTSTPAISSSWPLPLLLLAFTFLIFVKRFVEKNRRP
jgi:hypothetical protein